MRLSGENAHVQSVLALVAERRGFSFHDYRREPLVRGMETRRIVTGCATLASYLALLKQDTAEIDRVVEAMLVPVTAFFRDAEVFAAMEDHIVGNLPSNRPLKRAWVAGCASGEEAWSLAMLLMHHVDLGQLEDFDIVASDIDARSLAVAGAATYLHEAIEAVPQRHQRFFETTKTHAKIVEGLRSHVRFAEHDLVGQRLAPKEATVAAFDIVFLRNVLIYLEPRLQEKALERLSSVLQPEGMLVLGTVETLPPRVRERFELYPGTTEAMRIYRLRRE